MGIIFNPLNDHLTDLIAVPVIASLGLTFQRMVMNKPNACCLKAGHVLFIIVYTAFVFEFWLPRHSVKYTADAWDVLMYFLGGVFFWFVMNRPLRRV